MTSIGKRAFAGCYGLTSIVIPSNLTSIGDDAFQNCSALTSISIPSNLTSIGDNAFYNCNGLLSIQVENGNLVYDSRENCNAIIKTADNTIILGCQNTIIPNSVTIIGDNAFYSCADLTSISIPTGVEIIGDCAFCGCKGLTTIDIPNSVTSIGKYAFASCEGLTSVTIPNGVTTIDEYAFAWCSNLLAITIANSVTTIGEGAFIRTGLKDMYCYSEQVPETGNNIFDYSNREATLHVPAASVEAYSNAEQWKDFGIIVALTDSDPIPTEIIASTTAQQSQIVDCYDLNGRRIIQPQRGINIFKMSDGTTKMVLVK